MLIAVGSRSHIFDGKNLTKETAAFQLCDIEDPMLKEMIDDQDNMQEECDVSILAFNNARVPNSSEGT